MGTNLLAALQGEPWCLAGAVHGVDHVLDDEGRPVSERRAPSAVKTGVEMELRACPYHDEREGQPMNVSALAQVSSHLPAVLAEIRRVRAAIGPSGGYLPVLAVVMDQLALPAVHLLRRRDEKGPVPARLAVGHKLAAGFFGVVRGLVALEAEGAGERASVRGLLEHVRRERSLVGESEVCAGPPPMIERAAAALVERDETVAPLEAPGRLLLATTLARQVRLGIAWQAFDEAADREILGRGVDALRPRTTFVRAAMEERLAAWTSARSPGPSDAPSLPDDAPRLADLRAALNATGEGLRGEATRLHELLRHGDGALSPDPDLAEHLCRRLARYALVRQAFVRSQWELERTLRAELAFDEGVPVHLHGVILAPPRALRWFEAALGHRLVLGPQPHFAISLRNHRREVPLFA